MSVTEISHRSKWFDEIINDAIARTKRLLNLDDHRVSFLQGGASLQFCMVPMNFLTDGQTADYVRYRHLVDESRQGSSKFLKKNVR